MRRPYSPCTTLLHQIGLRTIDFKAKVLHACCLIFGKPSGAMAFEYLTLCHFFFLFIRLLQRQILLGLIQTQLQIKRQNIVGQSPASWRKNEDQRGEETQMRDTRKTCDKVRSKKQKHIQLRYYLKAQTKEVECVRRYAVLKSSERGLNEMRLSMVHVWEVVTVEKQDIVVSLI